MDILQVENLSFAYPTTKKVLDDMSFTVKSGDFVVVCGETGCGKTTLLRMLKPELTPVGEVSGVIRYNGRPLKEQDKLTTASQIGFVMQKPENQLVTDKVWHELAFGLENMGLPTPVIRRRVSEMSSYFGISDWFYREVSELSGGQKQLLNLASIMVMQPQILILDEPTSQLDPIAAAEFIATLQKLNRELSLTIILVEHRLEDVLPIADKVLLMKDGKVACYDEPRAVCAWLGANDPMARAMPTAVRIFHGLNREAACPLTVKEGRRFIEAHFRNTVRSLEKIPYTHSKQAALEMDDIWFRYEKDRPDILRGTQLTVYENEIYGILGGNAAGKSTALNVAAGLLRPYKGKVKLFGKKLSAFTPETLYKNNLAYLPQDVQTVFVGDTVGEDLAEVSEDWSSIPYDLTTYAPKHPYDLSGGQQQLCALAKVLLLKPKLLLLDEPTKGIDAHAKLNIAQILKDLKKAGMTIVIVTHDVEFAALCADRCGLFFGGEITSSDVPSQFFAENNFYTTAANRMTRQYYDNIVTPEQAISICKRNG